MITPLAHNLPRRYPGLKPFDRTQSALFYGRGTDVQRLTNLILRERLVVMFAKSGIGKTSLLQAGVAPELELHGFAPILLRLNEPETPLIDAVNHVLRNHPLTSGFVETNRLPDVPLTLWEQMKRLQFDLDGLPATPVLIFDQFEELFTLNHTEESRSRFLSELADLANEAMPEAVRHVLLSQLQGVDHPDTKALLSWWEDQPQLRVVLSIRSDFLHLLDEISPMIPGILHNRYQLRALDKSQAADAITKPAAAEGPFASKPFVYHEDALTEMLDFLSGKLDAAEKAQGGANPQDVDLLSVKRFDEIESFNLQIICRYIEEKNIREHAAEGFLVSSEYYGGRQGLRTELQNFYHNQLETLPEIYTRRTGKAVPDPQDLISVARRLIEDSLVTPAGRRCSMVDDFLINTHGVSVDFLDTLVDSRLLRKEMRLDDFYYEISHDTLLPAIVESRDVRRRREQADQERQALEKKLAEEEARRTLAEKQLKDINLRRKLANRVVFFTVTTLLITLAFAGWFIYNYIRTVEDELSLIERNVRLEIFEAAMPAYDTLLHKPIKQGILKRRLFKDMLLEKQDAQRFESLHKAIETENMATGDSLFFRENYAEALRFYRVAGDSLAVYQSLNYQMYNSPLWRIDPKKIEEKTGSLSLRTNNARRTLISQFRIRQTQYETFSQANAWGQALRCAEAMEHLLPEHPDDLLALQEALSLGQETPGEYVDKQVMRCRRALR